MNTDANQPLLMTRQGAEQIMQGLQVMAQACGHMLRVNSQVHQAAGKALLGAEDILTFERLLGLHGDSKMQRVDPMNISIEKIAVRLSERMRVILSESDSSEAGEPAVAAPVESQSVSAQPVPTESAANVIGVDFRNRKRV